MTEPQPALQRIADTAGALYTLPTVAAEVLRLTNDPRVDVPLLKKCIENDPALAGRLLRVVNSSLFGLSRQVSNLSQALALLGTKPLKLLVLGFSLPRGMFVGVEARVMAGYWHHALVKAVAAREIADALSPKLADEAFLVGLLQDLGMLVLIQQLGPPYQEFVEGVNAEGGSLREAERAALGFDHAELSACLLRTWGLPSLLVEAVGPGPAETDASGDWSLRRIADLAEEIARALADQRKASLDELLRRLRAEAGHIPLDLEAALLRIEKTVDQLAEVLSLELPQRRSYAELLAEAHDRLAAVAADAAGDLMLADLERVKQSPPCARSATELARAMDRLLRQGAWRAPAAEPSERSAAAGPASVARGDGSRLAAAPAVALDATDDPALVGRLTAFAATCRQQRVPLTLMLVEVEDFSDAVFRSGAAQALELRESVAALCQALDWPHAVTLPVSETRFAILLPGCDRSRAVRLGAGLVEAVLALHDERAAADQPHCGVSVGLASVAQLPKNFPIAELVARADRCLFAALACGGGLVKSIEIC